MAQLIFVVICIVIFAPTSGCYTLGEFLLNTLYLLRHAHAERAGPEIKDKDRALNDQGLRACQIIGQKLLKDNIHPDLILCSTAKRTRQTLDAISHIWQEVPDIDYEDSIYEARFQDIRSAIGKRSDRYKDIMVIGHNPGLQDLALHLGNTPGAASYKDALRDFSPGSMAKLCSDDDSWIDITPGKFTFLKFYRP